MNIAKFIHQKPYERIERKIRRHPIITVPSFFFLAILLAIPVIIYLVISNITPLALENQLIYIFLVLLGSVYLLSIAVFYYTYFINYYLDLLVVTNDRILHVEQENIFARTMSEVDLYQIQDVTSSIDGFFPSIFNYGTLSIQTAGATERFRIPHVPDPEGLRQTILDLADEDRKHHAAEEKKTLPLK